MWLFCWAAVGAWAEPAASLKGVVEDPTGAPIPMATVSVRDNAASVSIKVETDDAGQFSLALPDGSYVLRIHADGFDDSEVPARVSAGHSAPLRLRLKVAVVAQELTVSATADPVPADGNLDAVRIDHDLLKSLPVMESNPLAAATLFVDPAANGSQGTTLVVDGVEDTGGGLDVPATSVKQVSVNKNPYSAEFSRPGKGRIEVTTRPGSSHRIHKHLIATLNDSALDATNAFAAVKAPMTRSLLEGSLDGPLAGDLGTFYLGADYLRDDHAAIVNAITTGGPFLENVDAPQRQLSVLGRTDLHLTALNTLSLRYNLKHSTQRNQGVGDFDLAARGLAANYTNQDFRLLDTAAISANFSNEARFIFKDHIQSLNPLSNDPAVLVLGAFNGGGAQRALSQHDRVFEWQDFATFVHGRHTLRAGLEVKHRSVEVTDRSDFGGTFSFSSLAAFSAGTPFQFAINTGDPAAQFGYWEGMYFLQDEVRLRRDLNLLVGLRHEVQSNLDSHGNIAPRFSISYAPGSGNTVLRVGAGMFYDRMPAAMEQQALRFDGAHVQRFVAANPTFPMLPVLPASLPQSIVSIDPALRAPTLLQASLGVEHRFSTKTYLSVDYTFLRGEHLFRMRNLNAPLPLLGIRPDPAFLNVDQFESNGSSRVQSLAIMFRTAFRKRFELMSQYVLSRALDDTSGMSSLPANNYDLSGEWGRADYDRRHRVNIAGIVNLPRDFRMGTILSFNSGAPFNITTGKDNNLDTVANDRPLGVGRNTGAGPAYADVDLRLSKRVYLSRTAESKGPYVEFRFDAFNVLNTVNAVTYVGNLSSPLFGRANSALPARQLQLSIKASF